MCFLHVSKAPESEKVVFEKWSVCMSVVTLQPKRIELRTPNLVHNLLVLMGHDNSIFEKNRACAKDHRTFWDLTMLQNNGSNDFDQNRCIVGP